MRLGFKIALHSTNGTVLHLMKNIEFVNQNRTVNRIITFFMVTFIPIPKNYVVTSWYFQFKVQVQKCPGAVWFYHLTKPKPL